MRAYKFLTSVYALEALSMRDIKVSRFQRSLMQQMGADYASVLEFARKARPAILAVKQVSRIKLSFPQTGGGLWLHPSPTAIPPRKPRTITQ
ncbi:MAG: hypothetical protein ABI612_17315 [Betaproteobacteria bacterium]